MNINSRSIANKSTDLELILYSHDPHVTILTETWLHDGTDDSDLILPSHCIFRKDRPTRGGAVAIIVKSNIEAVLVD